ncbi:MAG: hypothetical protein A2V98_22015 [Planctomycetes bacterium RBG_16_64_12]|nr:MAG: hypothetical protein A2V98_22015 [Planctomycetes bacterium RBG_16_64_12]
MTAGRQAGKVFVRGKPAGDLAEMPIEPRDALDDCLAVPLLRILLVEQGRILDPPGGHHAVRRGLEIRESQKCVGDVVDAGYPAFG